MDRGTVIAALAGAAGLGYLAWRNWRDGQPPEQRSTCDAFAAVVGEAAEIGAPAAAAGASPATALAAEQNAAQAREQASQAARLGCNAWQKLPTQDKVIGLLSWPALTIKYGALGITEGLSWVGSKVFGGGRDVGAERARNAELNGPIVAAADPQIPLAFVQRDAPGIQMRRTRDKDGRLGWEIPLRHANGCVPYSGHPESARCAPGTTPQDRGANRYTAAMGTGRPDDPVSGRHRDAFGRFPLPVAAGAVAFWDRGEAKVCVGGVVNDHRAAGGGIYCAGTVPAPPVAGAGGATVRDGDSTTTYGVIPDATRGHVPRRQAG